MKFVKWLARLLCSTVVFIVGIYTFIGAAVAVFIVTGRLTPGEMMIFDFNTPSIWQALGFVVVGAAIVGMFALARHKLRATTEKSS